MRLEHMKSRGWIRGGAALGTIGVALLAGVSVRAAATDPEPPLPTLALHRFVEQQTQRVNVGGHPIVGITTDEEAGSATGAPAIRIPAGVPGSGAASGLCIETSSIDGTYSSHGEIDAADLAATKGSFRLRYHDKDQPGPDAQPKFDAALQKYQPGGIATLAQIGSCSADSKRDRFVVVDRRGKASSHPAGIKLYVNTAQYDIDVRYASRDGVAHTVSCQDIEGEEHRQAFSATCVLAGPFNAVTELQLVRNRYGRQLPPLPFSVVFVTGTGDAASR